MATSSWAGPDDKVLFSGDTSVAGQSFTISDIEALGFETISARSPHEPNLKNYSGVWLRDVIQTLGSAQTSTILITAIDFYQVTFSREEWEAADIFLATRLNGKHLEIEDRGPLRVIVSDYSPSDKVQQELIPKWIWMISEIEFKD